MSVPIDVFTVYIVDGDPEFLFGLSRDLQSNGLAVQTYDTTHGFLAEFDGKRRGCVVVDICLPGMSGINLINDLAMRNLSSPVIAVNGCADALLAAKSIEAGAGICFEKPVDARVLTTAIEEAVNGSSAAAQLRAQAPRELAKLDSLSPRERAVLDAFARGLSTKEIAGALALSAKSVETYRARLTEKLDAKSPAKLMRIALLATLIEPFR